MLCTSGFMDDAISAHNGSRAAYRSIQLQRVTSLRRRAHAIAPQNEAHTRLPSVGIRS